MSDSTLAAALRRQICSSHAAWRGDLVFGMARGALHLYLISLLIGVASVASATELQSPFDLPQHMGFVQQERVGVVRLSSPSPDELAAAIVAAAPSVSTLVVHSMHEAPTQAFYDGLAEAVGIKRVSFIAYRQDAGALIANLLAIPSVTSVELNEAICKQPELAAKAVAARKTDFSLNLWRVEGIEEREIVAWQGVSNLVGFTVGELSLGEKFANWCASVPSLKAIDFSTSKVASGSVLERLVKLPGLTHVGFPWKTPITESLVAAIEANQSLTSLEFSFVKFQRAFTQAEAGSLSRIQQLRIGHSELTSKDWIDLRRCMTGIRLLDLRSVKVETTRAIEFVQAQSELQALRIAGWTFRTADFDAVVTTGALWYLDLSECRLPAGWGALVGEVATLKWLGVGYIKDNLETEVRSATKAGNLEVLDLRWTGARPEFLAELRKDGAVRVYYSSTHSTDD